MADYIERGSLIKALSEADGISFDSLGVFDSLEIVDSIPSADVAPVVHGEWKWRNGGECSECGFHNSNFDYNFCPNCGAKMDLLN